MPGPTFVDDAPAARIEHLRERLCDLATVPLPGHGETRRRFRVLADAGRRDASLGRLLEGHLDALAIRAELGAPRVIDRLLGVWAARPDEVRATPTSSGWHLRGVKPWCSGAGALDRALLTAVDEHGRPHLFDVDVAALGFRDDWEPMGMQASDSRTADVDVVVARGDEVGQAGAYVDRAGFGHGGVGVAAVWYGVADHLGGDLATRAAGREDPHLDAAAGEVSALLAAAASILRVAAGQIDTAPHDVGASVRRAAVVRNAVGGIGRRVATTVAIAGGASPLAFDRQHARALADLTVYLGQLHHGHDAAGIRRDDAWDL